MTNTSATPILTAVYAYPQSGMYPAKDLTVGEAYVVNKVEMGGWHTDIILEGKDSRYNSVQFDFFEDGEPVDIYSSPRYNPFLREFGKKKGR